VGDPSQGKKPKGMGFSHKRGKGENTKKKKPTQLFKGVQLLPKKKGGRKPKKKKGPRGGGPNSEGHQNPA